MVINDAVNCLNYITTVKNEYGAFVEWHLQKELPNTRRNLCYRATLSNIKPTWIGLELNRGLPGEMPATYDLSHGTAA